jgi:hypothetical protein
MKKVGLLILVLGVLGVLAFGMTGSGAWFTSSREISNNAISTGTLDLGVEGGPFAASDLQPGGGWQNVGWFCATNNGNYDMKWRGWMFDMNDPKGLRDFLHIRVTINPNGHQGNYGPMSTVLVDDVPFTALLSDTNTTILLDGTTVTPGDPAFSPQSKICYQLDARLDSTAGDGQQNGALSGKLNLFGTQWIAPW